MPRVISFRGIRYNPEKIDDLAAVVTPPYDVIDSAAQKKYYEKSPYNVIRLEFGYQFPEDNEKNNRYTRAAHDYNKWLENEVLVRESKPAFYLYEQEFSLGAVNYKRTGFFARVQLEEFFKGGILPHEETLVNPKADRFALMSACAANFSPIFAFYVDPELTLDQEFDRIKNSQQPEIALTDEVGEKHRIWVIDDPQLQEKVDSVFKQKELYIADGHHRYETALEFYRKNSEKYKAAGYILMYLVNACDPGLVILPTHRIVHSLPSFDPSNLLTGLEKFFVVEKLSETAKLDVVLKEQQEAGKTAFVMGTREPAFYLLVLKNPAKMRELSPGRSAAWCSLDAAVLQTLIFQELLGLTPDSIAKQENIKYTRDTEAALDALSQDAQLVFLLNPTKISQIMAVASAGDKMPQKSTYFYPKLLTGLVINDLNC